MVDLQPLLAVLTVALGLSAAVERFLAVISNLLDRFFFSGNRQFKKLGSTAEQEINKLAKRLKEENETNKAEEMEEIRARLKNDGKTLSVKEKATLEKRLKELEKENPDTSKLEHEERFSEAEILVEPASELQAVKILRIFWLQIFGTLAGIVLCFYSKVGVFAKLFEDKISVNGEVDFIFTGILIGAGSQPIHFLIKFLTERKLQGIQEESKTEDTAEEVKQPQDDEKKSTGNGNTVPVPEIRVSYHGGVDRDALEQRHLRNANPDLIIFHHTAMHSDSNFVDVVNVIKDRGWLTGYNCVVLNGGSIHPFCRWDRFGSHAKGYNRRSLGIALNGNFETNPSVPFANVNGRFGAITPTDIQLRAAARVVALWSHLYGIDLDWEKSIIPHRQIAAKACPGSNFPYDGFKKLIEYYHTHWQKSPEARDALELYKQKQYLFVNKQEVS